MFKENSQHIPVLFDEVMQLFAKRSPGIFLDCTFGGGGHSRGILQLNSQNVVIATDRDSTAVERSRYLSQEHELTKRLIVMESRFSELQDCMLKNFIQGPFNGILADLGVSTDQLRGDRGFSFHDNGPLDMRMTPSDSTISAYDIVNNSSVSNLYALLREGGVGKEARQITNAIMRCRPIQSTKELVDCVASVSVSSSSSDGKHPATVVFQALRIAVNNEFSEIDALLDLMPKIAAPGALAAIISFHSLEDARVAKRFRQWGQGDTTPANWRGMVKNRSRACLGILHTKNAIVPTQVEIKQNAASRSARMRVFEFSATN